MTPTRLDVALVRRGLATSRNQAQSLIGGGAVLVDGGQASKPSLLVTDDHHLQVVGPKQWVGRAAYKLVGAFEVFGPHGLSATGLRCLDIGASTGGFTEVLLHHGAAEVIALDVGHGQLAPTVAADPRVVERSGTTVRGLAPAEIGGGVDLVVADLSFISLTKVMAEIAAFLRPGAQVVLLVKPQFEVGREHLGHGGVVRAGSERERALRLVVDSAREHELSVRGLEPSPIEGGTGNREFLLWLSEEQAGSWGWEAVHSRVHQIAHDQQEPST